MNTEKFEGHHEGWRTLWLAIAGVMISSSSALA